MFDKLRIFIGGGRNQELYDKTDVMLQGAIAEGNKKAEFVLRHIQISDEAMKLKEAITKISDQYDNGFRDLLDEVAPALRVDVAVKLKELDDIWGEIGNEIDRASSMSVDLMRELAKLYPTKK
jgi:hypothetical protein